MEHVFLRTLYHTGIAFQQQGSVNCSVSKQYDMYGHASLLLQVLQIHDKDASCVWPHLPAALLLVQPESML